MDHGNSTDTIRESVLSDARAMGREAHAAGLYRTPCLNHALMDYISEHAPNNCMPVMDAYLEGFDEAIGAECAAILNALGKGEA